MPKFCILFAKSTPAWKKYTNAGRDKYQLCIDLDDDDKDGEVDDEIVLIWPHPILCGQISVRTYCSHLLFIPSNSICSLQECGSRWPFPIQTLFIYVIMWYPFHRDNTFNQSIFSENFRGLVKYIHGCVLSCSLHVIHRSSSSDESKNGTFVVCKGSGIAHEKKMFENVETKCPSVTPSIPYKSIAVIQYITSSQKQEKNSLICLWKRT